MNNKGFTLVEVIAVIALLGLVIIITSTGIIGGGTRAKEKMLETKIKNIEKAAVLYGQDNRDKINIYIDGKDDSGVCLTDEELNEYKSKYPLCYKEGEDKPISNCYYYFDDKNDSESSNDTTLIDVGFLADNPDGDDSTNDAYLEYDDKDNKIIKNPIDENKSMNSCKIQIYEKYGKIYAVYQTELNDGDEEAKKEYKLNCWK